MTAPQTAVEILEAARDLIADEKRWTTGTYARDASGHGTFFSESDACQWCALGAFMRFEVGAPIQIGGPAREYLERAAKDLYPGHMFIGDINDVQGHAAIMRLYSVAIGYAREAAETGEVPA